MIRPPAPTSPAGGSIRPLVSRHVFAVAVVVIVVDGRQPRAGKDSRERVHRRTAAAAPTPSPFPIDS